MVILGFLITNAEASTDNTIFSFQDEKNLQNEIKETILKRKPFLQFENRIPDINKEKIFDLYEKVNKELTDLGYSVNRFRLVINKENDIVLMTFKYREKIYYDLLNALENGKARINIRCYYQDVDYNKKVIEETFNKILTDYPEYGYIRGYEFKLYTDSENIYSLININYFFPSQVIKKLILAVDEKTKEIVKQVIKSGMTEREKVRALHDYLVLNTKYDTDNYYTDTLSDPSFTAYGALFNKVAVCQGYAAAMNKLLREADINSKMVTGLAGYNIETAEAHAWNLVEIDGQWYHLDATWDDPVSEEEDGLSHNYFLITAEQISKDHYWVKDNSIFQ